MGRRPRRAAELTLTLVDSSAWIEFLRRTESATDLEVTRLLGQGRVVVTDPVRMEVLAGARSSQHLRELQGLLARGTTVLVEPVDFDAAAALFRLCRARGATVRRMSDCLIAAVAIRADVPVLHHDRDFTALARWTPLRVA